MRKMLPKKDFGKNIDLTSHVDCSDDELARDLYCKAVVRLKDPDNWGKLYPDTNTDFRLIKSGNNAGPVAIGDRIRINVPGPGPVAGNGYDYVQIVKFSESSSVTPEPEIFMQLRPCSDPDSESDKTAHFFKASSSSSFVISRKGNRVTANYFGRNETINNNSSGVVDKIRNTLIGTGALAGLSEKQWKGLLDGLLSGNT